MVVVSSSMYGTVQDNQDTQTGDSSHQILIRLGWFLCGKAVCYICGMNEGHSDSKNRFILYAKSYLHLSRITGPIVVTQSASSYG